MVEVGMQGGQRTPSVGSAMSGRPGLDWAGSPGGSGEVAWEE